MGIYSYEQHKIIEGAWSSQVTGAWADHTYANYILYTSYSYTDAAGYTLGATQVTVTNMVINGTYAYGTTSNLASRRYLYQYQKTSSTTLRRRLLERTFSPQRKGEFVQTLIAADGTYPVDGAHTDGFWYVRAENATEYKYLIQDGVEIKTYQDSWRTITWASANKQDFLDHGMDDISVVPITDWKSSMKILCWSNLNRTPSLSATAPKSLHDILSKSYKGAGVVETEPEELPVGRKTLFLSAEMQGAILTFSLDDGQTWHDAITNQTMDIAEKEGNTLRIRATLPDEASSISALSYAWA